MMTESGKKSNFITNSNRKGVNIMIKITNNMSLDEIEYAIKSASDEEWDRFIHAGWDGWSLDGSASPDERGYFDGTGDLAWTKDEYIVIDMYTDRREEQIIRGFFDETDPRGW